MKITRELVEQYHSQLPERIIRYCRNGIARREIIKRQFQIYKRVLPEWQLQRQIIPMLVTAGLIFQEPDSEDRRRMLIYPVELGKNNIDWMGVIEEPFGLA